MMTRRFLQFLFPLCVIALIAGAGQAAELDDKLERATSLRATVSSLLDQSGDAAEGWPETLPSAPALVYHRPEPTPDASDLQSLAPSMVVLHERLTDHPDGVWVAFADGHLEFARSQDVLDECLEQLAISRSAWNVLKADRNKPAAAPASQPAATGTLELKLLDPDGKPISGAIAGVFGNFGDFYSDTPHAHFAGDDTSAVSDATGKLTLRAEDVFRVPYRFSDKPAAPLYILHEQRRLVAIDKVDRADFKPTATMPAREIRLMNACRVTGDVTCVGLSTSKSDTERVSTLLFAPGKIEERSVTSVFKSPRFEFLVPPGDYGLSLNSRHGLGTYRYIRVEPGQSELHLELDLVPARLPSLIGQPAPELRKIKGWKNAEPFTLADLRGKVVLLDFWGTWCGPCMSVMPELMKLHDTLQPEGLEIVAVHDDSVDSIAAMDAEIAKLGDLYWTGRDLPFRIALDGGGESRVPGSGFYCRGATTAEYGIMSFPTTLLVDRTGTIVSSVNIATEEGRAAVEALVRKPTTNPAH